MRTALILLLALCGSACRGNTMIANEAFPDPKVAALAQAAADGDAARVAELVADGADPNARGVRGMGLLQFAMLAQSKAGLRALLAHGADPNRPSSMNDDSAVHVAAVADDPDYLEIVLAGGGDPNARGEGSGTTPLAAAAGPRTDAQFRMLLAAGADPNRTDAVGNTALHTAAMINAGDHVLALLEAGADPGARNRQGHSFQHYVFRRPDARLTEEARAARARIRAWLEAHGIPVEDPGAS